MQEITRDTGKEPIPGKDHSVIEVEIGIFAHNEEHNIRQMLDTLASQDIFRADGLSVRVLLLANGCTDRTVEVAKIHMASSRNPLPLDILETDQGGKSRTWNLLVHNASRPSTQYTIFCDCDIEMPNEDTLRCMVEFLDSNPQLQAASSRAVKDIAFLPGKLTATEKLISVSGGQLDDWKTSICGQLYIARSSVLRRVHLPIGLPVEDGFLRAMILTDRLQKAEDFRLISGSDSIFHLYRSERTIARLIRHQIRIVIGSAINSAIFGYLREMGGASILHELENSSKDDSWVRKVCAARLPNWRYGWVPTHFLFKRIQHARKSGRRWTPKRMALVILGFCFDAVVYVGAQIKMARGINSGYW